MQLIAIWSWVASEQKPPIVDGSARWLLDKGLNAGATATALSATRSPFSAFALVKSIRNEVEHGKAAAACSLLPKASPSLANRLLSWFKYQIPTTEEVNLGLFWSALLDVYMTGVSSLSDEALNCMRATYARIGYNDDLLTKAIARSYGVFRTIEQRKGKGMKELIEDRDLMSLAHILDNAMERLVLAPNPDSRRGCALVVSLFEQAGWTDTPTRRWISTLKKDSRARVYKVFQ